MFHYQVPDKRKFKTDYVIITGVKDMPMTFNGEQLCYSAVRMGAKFPTEVYTKTDALHFIELSKAWRTSNGFVNNTDYKLIPVHLPY